MIIKYVNSNLQEINLNSEPYKLLVSDLLDYNWEVISSNNKIQGFGYSVKEKKISIDISHTRNFDARKNMNILTDLFEKDIMNGVPGRLYIDDQYMNCYIKSSKKANWETDQIILCEYGMITDYPFWTKESVHIFKSSEISSTNNKRYPGRYGYRYANGLNNASINNSHYVESNFKLLIYGKCINPTVIIGGNIYKVHTLIEEGERLEINTKDKTVIKIKNNGDKENLFNSRNKENYIFQKISSGLNSVNWNGDFDFDIVLYEERSEPKWQ